MKKQFLFRAARLAATLSMSSLLSGCALFGGNSSAVGVIGGSDGPTAVFVTSSPGASTIIIPAVILILIITVGIIAYLRSRKKK